MTSTIIDLAIVLLLITTLGAGYRFQKRLRSFRADTEAFEPLIAALDTASSRAETVLTEFRKATETVGTKLTTEADTTQRLLDDLDFMTKRADELADRLEQAISGARRNEENAQQPVPTSPPSLSEELPATPSAQRRRAPDLEKRLKTLR